MNNIKNILIGFVLLLSTVVSKAQTGLDDSYLPAGQGTSASSIGLIGWHRTSDLNYENGEEITSWDNRVGAADLTSDNGPTYTEGAYNSAHIGGLQYLECTGLTLTDDKWYNIYSVFLPDAWPASTADDIRTIFQISNIAESSEQALSIVLGYDDDNKLRIRLLGDVHVFGGFYSTSVLDQGEPINGFLGFRYSYVGVDQLLVELKTGQNEVLSYQMTVPFSGSFSPTLVMGDKLEIDPYLSLEPNYIGMEAQVYEVSVFEEDQSEAENLAYLYSGFNGKGRYPIVHETGYDPFVAEPSGVFGNSVAVIGKQDGEVTSSAQNTYLEIEGASVSMSNGNYASWDYDHSIHEFEMDRDVFYSDGVDDFYASTGVFHMTYTMGNTFPVDVTIHTNDPSFESLGAHPHEDHYLMVSSSGDFSTGLTTYPLSSAGSLLQASGITIPHGSLVTVGVKRVVGQCFGGYPTPLSAMSAILPKLSNMALELSSDNFGLGEYLVVANDTYYPGFEAINFDGTNALVDGVPNAIDLAEGTWCFDMVGGSTAIDFEICVGNFATQASLSEQYVIVVSKEKGGPDIYHLEWKNNSTIEQVLFAEDIVVRPGNQFVTIGKYKEWQDIDNWALVSYADQRLLRDRHDNYRYQAYVDGWSFDDLRAYGQSKTRKPASRKYVKDPGHELSGSSLFAASCEDGTGDNQNCNGHYGAYYRGYFNVPSTWDAGNEYRFHAKHDDGLQIRMDLDLDNQTAPQVVMEKPHHESNWVNQHGSSFSLVPGKNYYFEILHYEKGGHDYVDVGMAVKFSGNSSFEGLTIVDDSYLSTAGDLYSVGVLGKWDNKTLLSATSGSERIDYSGLSAMGSVSIDDMALTLTCKENQLKTGDLVRFAHNGGQISSFEITPDVYKKIGRSWSVDVEAGQALSVDVQFDANQFPVEVGNDNYVLLVSTDENFTNSTLYGLNANFAASDVVLEEDVFFTLGLVGEYCFGVSSGEGQIIGFGQSTGPYSSSASGRLSLSQNLENPFAFGSGDYLSFSYLSTSSESWETNSVQPNVFKIEREWCTNSNTADLKSIEASVSQNDFDLILQGRADYAFIKDFVHPVLLIAEGGDFASAIVVGLTDDGSGGFSSGVVSLAGGEKLSLGFIHDYDTESTFSHDVSGVGAADFNYSINEGTSDNLSLSSGNDFEAGDYLLVGHNGAGESFSSGANYPSFISSAIDKVWKLQLYGSEAKMHFAFDASGMTLPSLGANEHYALLVSNSMDFSSAQVSKMYLVGDLLESFDVEINSTSYVTLGVGTSISSGQNDLCQKEGLISINGECVLTVNDFNTFDARSNGPCHEEVSGAWLEVKFDVGEQYQLGSSPWTAEVSFDVNLYGDLNNTVLLKSIPDVDMSLHELAPEQTYRLDITKWYDELADAKLTLVSAATASTPTIDLLDPSLRFTASIVTESSWLVHQTPSAVLELVEVAETPDEELVHFSWDNSGCPVDNYEFQLLKLYNINEQKTTAADIVSRFDWERALSIEVPNSSVDLMMVEGEGYYAWRVRPIGSFYVNDIADIRNHGTWTQHYALPGEEKNVNSSDGKGLFYRDQFDDDLNFAYLRSFTEGGRISEAISYANGLGAVVQSQTGLPSNGSGKVIVNEVKYDFAGRGAVQSLSAPVSQELLGYNTNFMTLQGVSYGPQHFDEDANYLNENFAIAIDGGELFDYYSDNNPDPRIPHAEGIAMSRTLFENDGSGEVKETGGVGRTLALGQGHTTTVDWDVATEDELLRLFGEEAPDAQVVLKQVTKDANNIESVSYIVDGQVWATGLRKSDLPTNLLPLPSEAASAFSSSQYLGAQTQDGEYGLIRTLVKDFGQATDLALTFDMNEQMVVDACGEYCLACGYTVVIKVDGKDESFTDLSYTASIAPGVIGTSDPLTCSVQELGTFTPSLPTAVTLPKGTYTITTQVFLSETDAQLFAQSVSQAHELAINSIIDPLRQGLVDIGTDPSVANTNAFLDEVIDLQTIPQVGAGEVVVEIIETSTQNVLFESDNVNNNTALVRDDLESDFLVKINSSCCSFEFPIYLPAEHPCEDESTAHLAFEEAMVEIIFPEEDGFDASQLDFNDVNSLANVTTTTNHNYSDGINLVQYAPGDFNTVVQNMLEETDMYNCYELFDCAIAIASAAKTMAANEEGIEDIVNDGLGGLSDPMDGTPTSISSAPYDIMSQFVSCAGPHYQGVLDRIASGNMLKFKPYKYFVHHPGLAQINSGVPNKYQLAQDALCNIKDDAELSPDNVFDYNPDLWQLPDVTEWDDHQSTDHSYIAPCDYPVCTTNFISASDDNTYNDTYYKITLDHDNWTTSKGFGPVQYSALYGVLQAYKLDLTSTMTVEEALTTNLEVTIQECHLACDQNYDLIIEDLKRLYDPEGDHTYVDENGATVTFEDLCCTAQMLIEDCQSQCDNFDYQTVDCNGVETKVFLGDQASSDFYESVIHNSFDLRLPAVAESDQGAGNYVASKELIALEDLVNDLIEQYRAPIALLNQLEVGTGTWYDISCTQAYYDHFDLWNSWDYHWVKIELGGAMVFTNKEQTSTFGVGNFLTLLPSFNTSFGELYRVSHSGRSTSNDRELTFHMLDETTTQVAANACFDIAAGVNVCHFEEMTYPGGGIGFDFVDVAITNGPSSCQDDDGVEQAPELSKFNLEWEKTFGGDDIDYLGDMKVLDDGNLRVLLESRSGATGDFSTFCSGKGVISVELDKSNGNLISHEFMVDQSSQLAIGIDDNTPSYGADNTLVYFASQLGVAESAQACGLQEYFPNFFTVSIDDNDALVGQYGNQLIQAGMYQGPLGTVAIPLVNGDVIATYSTPSSAAIYSRGTHSLFNWTIVDPNDVGFLYSHWELGSDENFVFGLAQKPNMGEMKLVKRSAFDGSLQWEKQFVNVNVEAGSGLNCRMSPFGNQGILVAISVINADDKESDFGEHDIWLLAIDNQGDVIWETSLGGVGLDQVLEIKYHDDIFVDALVDAGQQANGSDQEIEFVEYRLDSEGNLLGQTSSDALSTLDLYSFLDNYWNYGDEVVPTVLSMGSTEDEFYVARSMENVSGDWDIYVAKFNGTANVPDGCSPLPIAINWKKPRPTAPSKVEKLTHWEMYERENAQIILDQIDADLSRCITNISDDLEELYISSCLPDDGSLDDETKLDFETSSFHHTLYYRDRAGHLLATVPPEGVNYLTMSADVRARKINPDHDMVTSYQYNSYGQLISQNTPDGGTTNFIYDPNGLLRFSQNSQQALTGAYSYTKYDALARIIEVGEHTSATHDWDDVVSTPKVYMGFEGATYDKYGSSSWPNDVDAQNPPREELTLTEYNDPVAGIYYPANGRDHSRHNQTFLRNRVSHTYTDKDGNLASLDDQVHSYYSYDPHGNVEWLITDIPGLGKNYLSYEYDLISGNVLEVRYNEGAFDQFYHRYTYDADNRLVATLTSDDYVNWDNDASYEYYEHGPLARTEIGEDGVQGMDYVYTLQGWLKGINHPEWEHSVAQIKGLASFDPGQDGLQGGVHASIAGDAFGSELHYFHDDFIGSNYSGFGGKALRDVSKMKTGHDIFELYNGNIAAIFDRTPHDAEDEDQNGIRLKDGVLHKYVYDALNRLKSDVPYEYDANPYWEPASGNKYRVDYSYDANGNLLTLDRNRGNSQSIAMDEIVYDYYDDEFGRPTNRLKIAEDHLGTVGQIDIGKQSVAADVNGANYKYDKIGNITEDRLEKIRIEWTVYGKVAKVKKYDNFDLTGTEIETIEFDYDASGNRVGKTVIAPSGTTHTAYGRDASGNPMAIYERSDDAVWRVVEKPIYGSARVGAHKFNRSVIKGEGELKPRSLVITEFSHDSPYNNSEEGHGEYVMVRNLTNSPMDLTDWHLFFEEDHSNGSHNEFDLDLASVGTLDPNDVIIAYNNNGTTPAWWGADVKEGLVNLYDWDESMLTDPRVHWVAIDASIWQDPTTAWMRNANFVGLFQLYHQEGANPATVIDNAKYGTPTNKIAANGLFGQSDVGVTTAVIVKRALIEYGTTGHNNSHWIYGGYSNPWDAPNHDVFDDAEGDFYARWVDKRVYELKDHLGNIRVLVSEVKEPKEVASSETQTEYFETDPNKDAVNVYEGDYSLYLYENATRYSSFYDYDLVPGAGQEVTVGVWSYATYVNSSTKRDDVWYIRSYFLDSNGDTLQTRIQDSRPAYKNAWKYFNLDLGAAPAGAHQVRVQLIVRTWGANTLKMWFDQLDVRITNPSQTTTEFAVNIKSYMNYYAFGMEQPDRCHHEEDARFGFQGQETDREMYGGAISYKYRVHDPRIGRFLSVDPLAPNYPHNSPYAFSENRVIDGFELEGLEHVGFHQITRGKTAKQGLTLSYGGVTSMIHSSSSFTANFNTLSTRVPGKMAFASNVSSTFEAYARKNNVWVAGVGSSNMISIGIRKNRSVDKYRQKVNFRGGHPERRTTSSFYNNPSRNSFSFMFTVEGHLDVGKLHPISTITKSFTVTWPYGNHAMGQFTFGNDFGWGGIANFGYNAHERKFGGAADGGITQHAVIGHWWSDLKKGIVFQTWGTTAHRMRGGDGVHSDFLLSSETRQGRQLYQTSNTIGSYFGVGQLTYFTNFKGSRIGLTLGVEGQNMGAKLQDGIHFLPAFSKPGNTSYLFGWDTNDRAKLFTGASYSKDF